MNEKKLLLLDAYALIFRAYYAMIRNPRVTSTGLDTSAVFGFVNTLHELLRREQPSHVAVCFDPPGGKTFRHEQYPAYKANREATPEGITVAVPFIKRILDAYGIATYTVEGFEADDVIGTLANRAQENGFFTLMITGDKDFGQLVTDRIVIYNPSKDERLGVEEIKAKYGLESPLQVIDILGLMGDTADNIPGCPGVGPKRAEELVRTFGSVENLLEHTDRLKGAMRAKVEANAEQIRFSKYLATIRTDVPVAFEPGRLERHAVDMTALREVFDELEFRTLTARLIIGGEANAGLPRSAAPTAVPVEPATAPSQPVRPQAGTVPSLFDDDPSPRAMTLSQPQPAPAERAVTTVVSDTGEAARLVNRLLNVPRVGIHIVADGDEAMRATIVGYALSDEPGKAYYLPDDAMGWMLQAVAPLFAGKATLVGNDIKRMMVMLACRDTAWTAPFDDVAVAHYVLQPERGHDTPSLAADLLGLPLESTEQLFKSKTRKAGQWASLPADRLVPWAGQMAAAALALCPVLDDSLRAEGMHSLYTDIELPLIPVLADMELAGARIDVEALNDYSVTLTEQMNRLDEECHRLAGTEFNTASPMQVGEVLFERLRLDPKAKKTRTGQYSTTEEVLLKLRDRHPLVNKILELRGIRKLLNTYVNTLPSLINPRTGRIHTTYNQTVTATGRLSSTNPNLQNIPVRNDEGREIRRAFIPAPGNVFFSADYSQIELRLVADMSDDRTMLEAFAANEDIHAITAARIYHEPLERVTPEQRRKAKTANFGILYGISAFGLAQRLDIPRGEAKMLIDGYFATFPGVRAYIDRSIEQARARGYVTTLYGRRRQLPDINSRNAVVRSFSERNAINAPIQGTAADIIKRAMIDIHRRMKDAGLRSRMILQVHDELNFDVVPAELETLRSLVVTSMEGAYEGRVRLTASHGAAANWLDAH